MEAGVPDLSVVIVVASSASHLRKCLQFFIKQKVGINLELIVPHLAEHHEVAALKSEFAEVVFHPVDQLVTVANRRKPGHEHLNELRSIGLRMARGRIIGLTEDHARPDANWCANVLSAHSAPHAVIGGAVENELDHALNWAVYFCDFSRYQNPIHAGPSRFVTDVNVSYKRDLLYGISGVWQPAYHETAVHDALSKKGETLWLSPDIIMYQHRENLTLSAALKERVEWGRAYAAFRIQKATTFTRLFFMVFSAGLPLLLVARKIGAILVKKRLITKFVKAFPLTVLLTVFWSFGEFLGYLTGRPVD